MRPLRCLLILLIVLLPAGPFATTFPVTKTEDTDDSTCDLDCSLREAIGAANTNPGGDNVPVPAGTYLLTLGELVVSDDVSIAGAGQASTIIDGNANDRVLDIQFGGVVEISGVTVQGGFALHGGPNDVFRANGGGILNDFGADLRLIDSTVSDNLAYDYGGGIANSSFISRSGGSVTLTNSTVSRNQAFNGGGGVYNGAEGTVSLIDSTVSGNWAANDGGGVLNKLGAGSLINSTVSGNTLYFRSGGGIANLFGEMTLTDSTVANNTAIWYGGGIYDAGGSIALIDTTVSGNAVDYDGGGVAHIYGDMILTNSTVSTNTADRYGGGILNWAGNLTLTNGTVSGNTAQFSGGGIRLQATYYGTVGLYYADNTIVAKNGGGNCSFGGGAGAFHSLGYNLTDDDSCGFTALGDLVVADAMLGPLADNGGLTETHALLAGSPAIDAGSPDCPPPTTDQRGVARPQGAACDIGAFEFEVSTILVEIDIKPGGNTNPINPKSRGVTPVAILGSDIFNVLDIDVTTLAFGPDGAPPAHKAGGHQKDVNHDGLTDLLFHYRTQKTGIEFGDPEACVTGEMLDGTPISGCDAVRTVPRHGSR